MATDRQTRLVETENVTKHPLAGLNSLFHLFQIFLGVGGHSERPPPPPATLQPFLLRSMGMYPCTPSIKCTPSLGSRSMYPLYPCTPALGSRSMTGYIEPYKDGTLRRDALHDLGGCGTRCGMCLRPEVLLHGCSEPHPGWSLLGLQSSAVPCGGDRLRRLLSEDCASCGPAQCRVGAVV